MRRRRVAVARLVADAIGIDRAHLATGADLDAELLQLLSRFGRQLGHEAAEHAIGALEQHDARMRRINASELHRQGVQRDLAHRAGHLDAGGSGADDDKGHPRSALRRVGAALGTLERADDAGADRQRIGQGLQPRRMPRPVVVAEVAVRRAGCDDQVVVGERLVSVERHLMRCCVDRRHFGLQDRQVTALHLAPQRVANRRADGGRTQARGRDLVQQRLEQVVVGAVDKRDLDVGLRQRAHRFEPAEAAADHQHLGTCRRCAHVWLSCGVADSSRRRTRLMWLRSAYSSSA